MSYVVIYHANCWDGFGSAWAAWKRLGDDVSYIPANYGQKAPMMLLKNKDVFIVDFSYPRDVLEEILEVANALLVLDHHKTAQGALEDFPHAIFDMDKSGARLTWEHFHPNITMPNFLRYIEDRDLWRFKLPDSEAVNAAIQSYPFNLEAYDEVSQKSIDNLKTEGESILRYKQQATDNHASRAKFLEWHGLKTAVVNASFLFSEIGHELTHSYGADIGLSWFVRDD